MASGDPVLAIFRPRERMVEACRLARAHGFEPLAAPLLEVVPLPSPAVEALLEDLVEERLAWVVFTSESAVRAAWRAASDLGRDLTMLLVGTRAAAIGPATSEALRARGVEAPAPDEHSSAGLVRLLAEEGVAGKRVALVRSDRGSGELPGGLAAAGAEVLVVPVYGLRMPRDLGGPREAARRTAAGEVDAFAFTSSLTAQHFLGVARDLGVEGAVREGLDRGVVGAVGEPTARALQSLGLRCDVVASAARFDALLAGLGERVRRAKP